MDYDPESGQVFKETIVEAKKPDEPWQYRFPRAAQANAFNAIFHPPKEGVKPLQDLCMEKLFANANSLLPETLRGLPQPIALRIWTALRQEGRESFRAWTAFVNAGFRERRFNHSFKLNDWRQWPLIETFDALSSPGCVWLVDLTLSDMDISASEWKAVARIVNLQNLYVQFHRHADGRYFDDRIVRAWANRARDDGALKRLQTFSLSNAGAITLHVFEHLSAFSMLDLVLFCGRHGLKKKDIKEAERFGWRKLCNEGSTGGVSSSMTYSHSYSQYPRLCVTGSTMVKNLIKKQRTPDTGAASSAPRLDARLGKLADTSMTTVPTHLVCFKRDPKVVVEARPMEMRTGSRPDKKRKLSQTKEADYAAMLCGG